MPSGIFPAMTITAKVHNHTITLPPEFPVAEGAEVQIILPEPVPPAANPHAWMEEFVGIVDTLPEDFAAEHDHYIHGTRKRAGR